MIRAFIDGSLKTIEVSQHEHVPATAPWLDLMQPTRAEELAVEKALGVELPTREEMLEIEPSSRLYQHNGATFLTAHVLFHSDTDTPSITPISFVLAQGRLVTIRYEEPRSFQVFAMHAGRDNSLCLDGPTALVGLVDAIIDRTADILERTGAEVDAISRDIFTPEARNRSTKDFSAILRKLGRKQDLISKGRDSLVTLARLLSFLGLPGEIKANKEISAHVRVLARDVASLTDHASFLTGNISFLLDSSLGLINVEQNQIIKIVSIVSVVFLPPTLVASIYGMNFDFMPELKWDLGYPLALLLMALAAVLPYAFFKRKGWL